MKSKRGFGIILVVVLIAAFAFLYNTFREKPVEGSKVISIEVVNGAGESKVYEVKTDAAFLKQAMEEAEGLAFTGSEGDYGVMLETINGESAVYEKDNAYWSVMVNGEYGNYGIESQPIEDGDEFGLVYTKAE